MLAFRAVLQANHRRDWRGRLAVANDIRRKIERDALVAGAAEELAQAVDAMVSTAEGQHAGLDAAALADLSAALYKFRDETARE